MPNQDFNALYTNANRAPDATPYDSAKLCGLVAQLQDVDQSSIGDVAAAIIATMLCAQRRGDAVPQLFHDLIQGKDDEEAKRLFLSFKQGVNVTWAFVGLPHCIGACLGLINELRQRGITVTDKLERSPLSDPDWLTNGRQTQQEIYRAVGNSEVMRLMSGYFPEIVHVANAAVFGFLLGGSRDEQRLELSEITVAGAIAAMGATRQARSHLKGSMGLGISVAATEAVWNAAEQVAAWNGQTLPARIDVHALAEEVRANLGN